MNSISLQFDRPWMFLVLIPVLALILVPFFLLPANRRNTFKKIAPAVLHCIIATILIIILSGFTVISTSHDQQVIILMDLSDSTKDYHSAIMDKAEQLKSLIGNKSVTGVVAFADDSLYSVELGSKSDIKVTQLDADATNIAEALTYADSLMDSTSASRIILLSDGLQTEGDASSVAYFISGHGTRIDSMYFDTTDLESIEMQISSVSASEGGYVGDPVDITVEIRSNGIGTATLKIYDNDDLVAIQSLNITEDTTVCTVTVNPETSGLHTFLAVLVPDNDTIEQNNSGYAFANVSGKASVLIICDKLAESELLADLLSEEFDVKTVTAKNAPNSIVKLCAYDEVILMNVNNNDLPTNYDSIIKTYVEDYGGSLLAVGGSETFMYGNMDETAIEEVLPVDFVLTEAGEGNSVAIMLVVDCSSSMSSNGYWVIAKQGAIKCVEALTENDYVGVISFSSTAKVNKSLTQATEANKDALSRTISGLQTSRGTQYAAALNLALEELNQSTADTKYVMFLSDGEPQDNYYISAVNKLADAGITVSTIAIGYSSNVLQRMANAGGGRYYAVTKVTDLPNIMLSETEQVTVNSFISGNIKVSIANPGALTDNMTEQSFPIIKGYVGVTAKEEATVYLTSEEGHPIYAEWNYGSGKAAIFTSDLSSAWCSNWYDYETSRELIKRMVETTVSATHKASAMTIDYTADGETVHVSVAAGVDNGDNRVMLSVSYGSETGTAELTKNTDGIYEGAFVAPQAGVYTIMASLEDSAGNVSDFLNSAYAAGYSQEYNAFASSGKGLLEALVSYSGGRVTSDLSYLAGVKMNNAATASNPIIPLAIIATVLFLADVAIRKIRWKDLVGAFRRK